MWTYGPAPAAACYFSRGLRLCDETRHSIPKTLETHPDLVRPSHPCRFVLCATHQDRSHRPNVLQRASPPHLREALVLQCHPQISSSVNLRTMNPPVGYGASNASCAKRSNAKRIGVRDTPRRTVSGCSEILLPDPNSPVKINSRNRITVRSIWESAAATCFTEATLSVSSNWNTLHEF